LGVTVIVAPAAAGARAGSVDVRTDVVRLLFWRGHRRVRTVEVATVAVVKIRKEGIYIDRAPVAAGHAATRHLREAT